MFPRILTKPVLFLLIVSFLVPSSLLFYPQKASAAGATCMGQIGAVFAKSAILNKIFKPVPTSNGTVELATGGSFVVDCVLTPLAIQLAKAMLQNMTAGVVNWINNGFKSDGNPIFVQDLRSMLRDSADQVIGNFIEKDLGAGFLCNSFSLQVKLSLAQSYMPYRQKSSCTLTQITRNANNFAQNNGGAGWDRWLEVTTVPQNNVYGATVLAQDELSKKIFDAQKIQKDYLDWGKGFRSWQECAYPEGYDIASCDEVVTKTPGGVIEAQLSASLQSDMKRLEVAENIDAIVGALTNQLMSQVIGGAQGLLGAGNKSKKTTAATYQSAINPANADVDLSNAIDIGLGYSTSEASNLFTPGETITVEEPVPSTDPDTGDVIPVAPETPVVDWLVSENSSPLADGKPLTYQIELTSNYSTTSMKVVMALKRNNAPARFLDVFVNPQITTGRADTSKALRYIDAATGAAWTDVSWNGVSAAKNTNFSFKLLGYRKENAVAGNYTLETSVYDVKGRLIKMQPSSFVVQ